MAGDFFSDFFGAAGSQIPQYQDTSPFAGMTAPTDPYDFSLGFASPNYGPLTGTMGMIQAFGPLLGIPDLMASMGVHGGFGQFQPGQVFASRRYSQISRAVNQVPQTPEALAHQATQFMGFEKALRGETVGVEENFATMRMDVNRFGGAGKVDAMEREYRDELAALEAAEKDDKLDRGALARRRSDLVTRLEGKQEATFKENNLGDQTFSARSSTRADNFAKMIQENPALVGMVSQMAKSVGIEGTLDENEFYRKTATQAASIQMGYGGGGKAGIDLFGPKAEDVTKFMGELDAQREKRGFTKQGITSGDLAETMGALSARGLGGLKDGQAEKVAEVSEAMKELEAVFGAGAPVEQIMRSLERMSNSSIGGMGGSRIKAWGQKVQAVADVANMSTQDLVRIMENGSQDAIRRGMSGDVGSSAALGAVMGAASLREQAMSDRGGAGSLTETQAQGALYQAGMEVSNSRMGKVLANVAGVAVTRAMRRGNLTRAQAEALSPQELAKAAGMGAETTQMFLDAFTAKAGTAEYTQKFSGENEGRLRRQLATDLGMSENEVGGFMFSDLNGSESYMQGKMLQAGGMQLASMREKFTALVGDKFARLRKDGSGGDMSKVKNLLDRAMAGNTSFNVKDFTDAEVSALQDSANEMKIGSVETLVAMAAGTKYAEQAEKAVSFNQALQKAGYGTKTTSQSIWGLVTGGADGGKRSLKQAFAEAAGALDVDATMKALDAAGIKGEDAANVLKVFESKEMSEGMLKDAMSSDPEKAKKARDALSAITLKSAADSAEDKEKKDAKLSDVMDKILTALDGKTGKDGTTKVEIGLSETAEGLLTVKVTSVEEKEKAAQEAARS